MDIVSLVLVLVCVMLSLLIIFVFVNPPSLSSESGSTSLWRGISIWLTDTLGSALVRLEEHFWFYVPLGIIGLWRWLTWGFKRACSAYYKPVEVQPHPYDSSMSIITPVYNEDPKTFRKALDSWEANRPDEIIAVIDASDQESIKTFREFSHGKDWAKLLITTKRGKREAIVDGIIEANSQIVALVDSDTIWSDDIRESLLAPFNDPDIAGVTPRNHPIVRNSVWQKMTDIFWDIRNYYDLPSQTAMGCSLTCLTGRTSLYRREILLPKLDEFLNEVLLGRRKESGEDKCFTRLVQK
nr:glycosyltransferase [Thermoproteota archaeon]